MFNKYSFYIISIVVFLAIEIVYATIESNIINKSTNVNIDELIQRKSEWETYKRLSYDINRQNLLKSSLQSVAGIYSDNNINKIWKRHHKKLNETVLISVIDVSSVSTTTSHDTINERYRMLLNNFLCNLGLYKISPLLFLIDSNMTHFYQVSKELHELFDVGNTPLNDTHPKPSLQIVSYPNYLFWSLLLNKTSPIQHEKGPGGTADYDGKHPDFKSFGALVMLVPVLEVLSLGYNVIYLDIDISMLEDPIPLLLHGDADFVVSEETRGCTFHSFIKKELDFSPQTITSNIEPNTGIMFIKSNHQSIEWYRKWLQELINTNRMNDQRVLSFSFVSNSKSTSSCNPGHSQIRQTYKHYYDNLIKTEAFTGNLMNQSKKKLKNEETFKYCFLNEFLFQNGKMDFFCRVGKEDGYSKSSIPAYLYGMKKFALSKTSKLSNTTFYYPLVLHFNYCGDKQNELRKKGLFVYDQINRKCLIPSNNQLVFNSSYHLDSLETFNNLVHATHHVKNHVIRPLKQINSLNSNQIMKYSYNFVDYFYKYDDSKQLLSRYIDANDIDDLKRKYFGQEADLNITMLTAEQFMLINRGTYLKAQRTSRILTQNQTEQFLTVNIPITRDVCESKFSVRNFKGVNESLTTPPALYTFPGSGNTWMRLLIEYATGYYTGSVYDDMSLINTLPGEYTCSKQVVAVKVHPHTHPFTDVFNSMKYVKSKNQKCKQGNIRGFKRAVLLIRNPYDSIWSEYQRRASKSHVDGIFKDNFNWIAWQANAASLSHEYFTMWHKYYRQILGTFTSNDVLIVKFEDLKDKTKRLSELNKVVQFLGYSKEELRFNCAFTLAENNRTHRSVSDEEMTKEIAYTKELVCRMWSLFGNYSEMYQYKPFNAYNCTGYPVIARVTINAKGDYMKPYFLFEDKDIPASINHTIDQVQLNKSNSRVNLTHSFNFQNISQGRKVNRLNNLRM